MPSQTKSKDKGISLKTIHKWLIAGTVIISVFILASTYDLVSSYRDLTDNSELHIKLRNDANELMVASDYLTESVQRFTLKGELRFMNEYFDEALNAKRRENAIKKMSEVTGTDKVLAKLENAMKDSVELMEREYYAMRLVVEANHYEVYPKELDGVELLDMDKELTPEQKMRRANEMVLDNEYYRQKDQIRKNMQGCLDELENIANSTDASALKSLKDEVIIVRIAIALQAIGIIFLVWLTSRLGIHPILNAVEKIRSDSKLDDAGAREFRYLVRAYNKMYEVYKKSIEKLNFESLHDELTGVYNRAGYQSILSTVNLKTTYMILFDMDNFKSINDTYGHETGDKMLIKLAQTLKKYFRTDDYICRIGGDEFIVFMANTSDISRKMIEDKINAINNELAGDDGLPAASISAGVVYGADASNPEDLFKKTDRAMYESKQKGKCTVTFYSEL